MAYKYITKKLVLDILDEACKFFNVDKPVIRFIRKKTLSSLVKETYISKFLIELGAYEDFDKENVIFAGCLRWELYHPDKRNEILFSLKIANESLKGLNKDLIHEYLKGVLSHELGHLDKWSEDTLENEDIANSYIRRICNMDKYNSVVEQIYKNIIDRGWKRLKETKGIERPVE